MLKNFGSAGAKNAYFRLPELGPDHLPVAMRYFFLRSGSDSILEGVPTWLSKRIFRFGKSRRQTVGALGGCGAHKPTPISNKPRSYNDCALVVII